MSFDSSRPPYFSVPPFTSTLTNAPSPFTMVDVDVDGKPLPPLPAPEYGNNQYGPLPMGMAPPSFPIDHPEYEEYAEDGEYYHPDDYGSPEYPEYNRLSTITERTERSEYSKHYPSARQVVYRDSISSNTEYGAFRGACRSVCGSVIPLYLSPQIHGLLQPQLRPYVTSLRILSHSPPCPHRGNGTPWG
jgi:hypothetical protein